MLPTKSVTVPVPQQTAHMYRGFINQSAETQPVSIRWADPDREFIDKQAAKIGITFSEFVRWCSYHVAKEMFENQLKMTNAARRAIDAQSRVNKDEFSDDTQ